MGNATLTECTRVDQILDAAIDPSELATVIKLVNQVDLPAEECCASLRQHAGWSRRLLGVYEAISNQRIDSVSYAVRRLGVRQSVQLLLVTYMFELLNAMKIEPADRTRLCVEAVETMLLCRRMNQAFCLDFQGEELVAGMAADFGRWLIYSEKPEIYRDLHPNSWEQDYECLTLESSCYGKDHAELGYDLANSIRLPMSIGQAIRDHHLVSPTTPRLALLVGTAIQLRYSRRLTNLVRHRIKLLLAKRNLDVVELASHLKGLQGALGRLDAEVESVFAVLTKHAASRESQLGKPEIETNPFGMPRPPLRRPTVVRRENSTMHVEHEQVCVRR